MTTKSKASTRGKEWDDDENEATNNFVAFSEIGDFIVGTLTGKKQTPSTLPDKKGELQWIYEVKVRKCSYHVLDAKKKVVEEAVEPEEGDIVSVGGRSMIDSRMARVKLGQIFGLKFTEELDPKTKGYNPTKVIKVYTPKGEDGEYEMDQEYLDENPSADDFASDK